MDHTQKENMEYKTKKEMEQIREFTIELYDLIQKYTQKDLVITQVIFHAIANSVAILHTISDNDELNIQGMHNLINAAIKVATQ